MVNLQNYKYDLLLKEIDLISGNIKNLDDIIYKTKNFAFAFWGGSIFLITKLDASMADKIPALLFLTAIIPVMFWTMDYHWRGHLRFASTRERIISLFINSPEFAEWLADDNGKIKFPLYDPVGWIYTTTGDHYKNIPQEYLIDRTQYSFWNILLYKDAKWYYSIMIIISLLFGMFNCLS